jgi:hypothetical protein
LRRIPDGSAFNLDELDRDAVSTEADENGDFIFQPARAGSYLVEVTQAGYSQSSGQGSRERVVIGQKSPSVRLKLWLERPTGLSGRVVDELTGEGAAGLAVTALRVSYRYGRRLETTEREGPSGANGRFELTGLKPGNYVVRVSARDEGERLRARFSAEEESVVDQAYPTSYWPGGRAAMEATPVALVSGARVELGNLSVGKRPHYRVRLDLGEGACENAASYAVIEQIGDDFSTIGQIGCGAAALVRGVPEGLTSLMLLSDAKEARGIRVARLELDPARRRGPVIARPEAPIAISGRFEAQGGRPLPKLSNVHMWLSGGGQTLGNAGREAPDGEGHFELLAAPARQRLNIAGLDPAWVVAGVYYNNTPCTEGAPPLDVPGGTHELVIRISDRPREISGMVKVDAKEARPYVILTRAPLNLGDPFSFQIIRAGEQGQFRCRRVAPGEYRIFAVAAELREQVDEPGRLAEWFAHATAVQVGDESKTGLELTLSR